jgi:hypothetical protein
MVFTTMRMEVEAEYYSLVIGKGGAGLQALESMPGVIAVEFSPIFGGRNPFPSWPLTVRATSKQAAQEVLDRVSLWMLSAGTDNAVRFPVVSWLLLPEEMTEGSLTLRRLRDATQGDSGFGSSLI